MGLLSNIKQRLQGMFNRNKALNPGSDQYRDTQGNGTIKTNSYFQGIPCFDERTGETIYFQDCKDTEKHFAYQNGLKTTIIEAKIAMPNDRALRGETSVCFEVPVGTTIEQLVESGMLQQLINFQTDKLNKDVVNNLGRVDFQRGNIYSTLPQVQNWIDNNLTAKLQEEKNNQLIESRNRAEARKIEEDRAKSNLIAEANRAQQVYDSNIINMKQQRIQNPVFKSVDGQNVYELNSLKTGNIIDLTLIGEPQRIKHTDGSIDYVYSAFRQDKENRQDVVRLGAFGANMQFSLPVPIEQMEAWANDQNNPENAKAIAKMMEQLMDMPKYGNTLFVGAIKLKDGMLSFGDNQNAEKTMRLLGQDTSNRSNNQTIQKSTDENYYGQY